MNPQEILTDLKARIPALEAHLEGEAILIDTREKLPEVAHFLKENEKYRMDYVSCLTGVDYLAEGYLESVAWLFSVERKHGPICLKVRAPRNNPRVPSLTPIYRGAEFQERESYDLLGIIYEGHPDLRRILMWDEFEGHPLRKDYIQEDQDTPLEED